MGKLLEELKRRKVFRVAAIYAVVAWVVMQVADTLFPALQLPGWTVTFITVLLILGFFPTMVVAWAYQRTLEGVKPDLQVQPSNGLQATTAQPINYLILAIVLLVAGFQVADRFVFEPQISSVESVDTNPDLDPDLSRRTLINLGVTVPMLDGPGMNADIALSADGRRLAYTVARPDSSVQVFIQELDQLESRLLVSQNGYTPFFSPDGEWLAYGDNGSNTLYRISIRGGQPQVIAESQFPGSGGFWAADGNVYYTNDSGTRAQRQLRMVSSSGGVPEPLVASGENSDIQQFWPWLLPDQDTLLYTERPNGGARDGRIHLLIQSTGEDRVLIENAYNARYVPSGHIVFMRSSSLWAVPFDPDLLEPIGQEVPVIQGVHTEGGRGMAAYSFSNDGLLVYLPGEDVGGGGVERSLVWVDRDGNEELLPVQREFVFGTVSPSSEQIAIMIPDNANADIWTYDLVRDTVSRLTFHEDFDIFPVWTPGGERIVFGTGRDSGGIWWKAADGTGQAEPLLIGYPNAIPWAFTPDGSQLVYTFDRDIYLLTLDGNSDPQPLVQTQFDELNPDLSADGRWIAYASNETGQYQIYVRPFPDVDNGRYQISSSGGRNPKWHPNGRELFFRGETSVIGNSVWSAQVETEAAFQFETPERLFSGNYQSVSSSGAFDLSADGSRFLLMQNPEDLVQETEVTLLVAVENWFEELKRVAPPDQN